MMGWGMKNGALESWGPFGKGWELKGFTAQVISPQTIPLIAYPKAWSPGTNGPVTGDVILLEATDEAGLEPFKGKLKGAIVMISPVREPAAHFTPQGKRYTDEELAKMADAPAGADRQRGGAPAGQRPAGAPGVAAGARQRPGQAGGQFQAMAFNGRKISFAMEEGAAIIADSARGDGGTMFVQSATVPQPALAPGTPAPTPGAGGFGGGRPRVSPWDLNAPKMLPQVSIASEHYNRIGRMLKLGEKVRATMDVAVAFQTADTMCYNTVAEIPGTDKADEVVMLGGHMDSWHSGTGATDNAAGVAVAMEAARILQSIGVKPRRTIRVALWSGEEEGLFGSTAYVKQHFGTVTRPVPSADGTPAAAPTLTTKPEWEKFSAYFNLDNGTGKIRGIYCQGNEAVKPIFTEWLAPFKDMGATTVTLSNTGSTDHVSFDAVGLPGFQFIQDTIEYDTRTHHSNQDVYDRIQADDVKQAAIILATFVYNTAMRDDKLPRKPAPGTK